MPGLEWTRNEDGVGGWAEEGSLVTVSHTFTIDRASGFVGAPYDIDLGADRAFQILVTMSLVSFDGDGEVLGNDSGTLYVGQGFQPIVSTNSDGGEHFTTSSQLAQANVNHYVAAAQGFVFELQGDGMDAQSISTAARYVRLSPQLVSNDGGSTYAGANDPVAVATMSVTYLA